VLWIAGLFAITGTPPFGLFQSELVIFRAALDSGQILVAVIILIALGIIFVGMSCIVLNMVFGSARTQAGGLIFKESLASVIPPAVLCVGVVVLGVYIPSALYELLLEAAKLLGGR